MSKEIGTLVIVVLKARNLPDKHVIYKQDVFTQMVFNDKTKKTKVEVRGGQHPVWDDEVRFTIYKNTSADARILEVSCWRKESKTEELIGKGKVDISETLRTGEFDDWVQIDENGSYRGEVYLEMTYFSTGPTPLQRRPTKMSVSERLTRPSQPYVYPDSQTPPKMAPQSSTSPRSSLSSAPNAQRRPSPIPESSLLTPTPPVQTSPRTSPHTRVDALPSIAHDRLDRESIPEILRPGNPKSDIHYNEKPNSTQWASSPPRSPPLGTATTTSRSSYELAPPLQTGAARARVPSVSTVSEHAVLPPDASVNGRYPTTSHHPSSQVLHHASPVERVVPPDEVLLYLQYSSTSPKSSSHVLPHVAPPERTVQPPEAPLFPQYPFTSPHSPPHVLPHAHSPERTVLPPEAPQYPCYQSAYPPHAPPHVLPYASPPEHRSPPPQALTHARYPSASAARSSPQSLPQAPPPEHNLIPPSAPVHARYPSSSSPQTAVSAHIPVPPEAPVHAHYPAPSPPHHPHALSPPPQPVPALQPNPQPNIPSNWQPGPPHETRPYSYYPPPPPKPEPSPVSRDRYTKPLPLPNEPEGVHTPTPANPQPHVAPAGPSRPPHEAHDHMKEIQKLDEELARRLEEQEEARHKEAEERDRQDEELAKQLDLELNNESPGEGAAPHIQLDIRDTSLQSKIDGAIASSHMPGSW